MLTKRFVSAKSQAKGVQFYFNSKFEKDPLVPPLLLQTLKNFGLMLDSNPCPLASQKF